MAQLLTIERFRVSDNGKRSNLRSRSRPGRPLSCDLGTRNRQRVVNRTWGSSHSSCAEANDVSHSKNA